MSYTRKNGDVEFRKVPLTAATTPEFQPFAYPDQRIDYPDDHVLEIKREDGTTVLDYSYPKKRGIYSCSQSNQCNLPGSIPTARLWLRRIDGVGIKYKVPVVDQSGDRKYIYIPGGVNAVELVGDAYFETAYELRRG